MNNNMIKMLALILSLLFIRLSNAQCFGEIRDADGNFIVTATPQEQVPKTQVETVVSTAPVATATYTFSYELYNPKILADGSSVYSVKHLYQFCTTIPGGGCSPQIWLQSSLDSIVCKPTALLSFTLSPSSGEKHPRPAGAEGDGKSTYNMVAKVMEGGTPKKGMTVTFKVDVKANSGGHDHHDTNRPKGALSVTTASTDANGEVKLTFTSPEFAGTHTVTATCTTCKPTALTKEHEFDVKVPDLVALPADVGYTLRGQTTTHKSNHYFTPRARVTLLDYIKHMAELGWSPVGINDASLKWGGRFDIWHNWGSSHDEHRTGEEVDISFLVGTNASKISRAYDMFCVAKNIDNPTTILWHDIPPKEGGKYPLHFHLRLDGRYSIGLSSGKVAKCSKDSEKKKKSK